MKNYATALSYTFGFALSVGLTLLAFSASTFMNAFALPVVVGAALLQLLVQLVFFLHIGSKSTPRANVTVFFFTLLIIGIVVGGTLWIMSNLDHLHMRPATVNDLYENGTVAPQNELK
jgi:cytochrome o ubiquinol oxidase operon protein cyoD